MNVYMIEYRYLGNNCTYKTLACGRYQAQENFEVEHSGLEILNFYKLEEQPISPSKIEMIEDIIGSLDFYSNKKLIQILEPLLRHELNNTSFEIVRKKWSEL